MLKPNLIWQGKLNQWKIWKTAPMENLHQSLCTFKFMSMYKCFTCRTIIILECWNWTKDKVVLWWGHWTKRKFGGLVIWYFSVWCIFMKWQPFFQFFHNGWHWYSISVNTWKTGDSNFGGLVIWHFSVSSLFTKWQIFFNFFVMANADILFLLTLVRLETQTLEGSVIWNFSVQCIFTKWWPFINFFIMTNTHISFLLTLRKLETQTGASQLFEFFLYNAYLWNGGHFSIFS